VKKFNISSDASTIGFESYVVLNPLYPIESQLRRNRISLNDVVIGGMRDSQLIKAIIEKNASLKIGFGWSFELSKQYETIMNECIEEVVPKFNTGMTQLVADTTCSWLGFSPYNVFEREAYENLSQYSMIVFNNELIDYQKAVVSFLVSHRLFRQHSMLRDEDFRFKFFKALRNDSNALSDAYFFYLEAAKETCLVSEFPRDILEKDIGCHFLKYPDLFFELLDFSILQGVVNG
jgi:hypothetical protein